MGNICKLPIFGKGTFESLWNGEHLQISVLGAICKSLVWGTFANLRFGGHLQVFGMGNICKSPFWGPFASLRNGEQMQIIGEQMQYTPSYCYENISHINERSLVSVRLLVISYSLIASMHDKIEIGDL